jgi:hypothetical protein
MKALLAIVIAAAVVMPGSAQSEAALQQYFAGKSVTVKLDMPAAGAGMDVVPGTTRGTNTGDDARSKPAVAIRADSPAVITKIAVKKNVIEVYVAAATDANGKGQAPRAASRFNVRYPDGVPSGITPGTLMAALAGYVEFPFVDRVVRPGKGREGAVRASMGRPTASSASPPSESPRVAAVGEGATSEPQQILERPARPQERTQCVASLPRETYSCSCALQSRRASVTGCRMT